MGAFVVDISFLFFGRFIFFLFLVRSFFTSLPLDKLRLFCIRFVKLSLFLLSIFWQVRLFIEPNGIFDNSVETFFFIQINEKPFGLNKF